MMTVVPAQVAGVKSISVACPSEAPEVRAIAEVGTARVPVETDGLPDGATVTVSARPEDMEVLRAPAADAFALEDARLVNFGAYKRLLGRHPAFGQLEARVPKSFRLDNAPVYVRFTRARAFASDEAPADITDKAARDPARNR